MSDKQVALLRGINVGRAKRVAMADLRALVGDLGYSHVRTLLNSGNVVFTAHGGDPAAAAAAIQEGIAAQLGVTARVTVITAAELDTIIQDDPLHDVAADPSRYMVAVLARPADREKLESLLEENWKPERLALGERVAYVWCPDSIRASPLFEAVGRTLGDGVTARNWSTMTKIHTLVQESA